MLIFLQFYFIISLAVGGTNGYFPEFKNTQSIKPWNNSSPAAMKEFWSNREQWLPSWHIDTDDSSFIVDSVKVWAL